MDPDPWIPWGWYKFIGKNYAYLRSHGSGIPWGFYGLDLRWQGISTWNPNDLYFLKSNPTKQGLNSNPNKGQLGSRYIYLFEDELWSIYDVFKDDKELTRTVQKHLMAKQYVQKKKHGDKRNCFIQLTRLKLTLTWLAGKPTMNKDVSYISYYSKWCFSVIMLVSGGYVYIENMFFWSKQILWTVHMTIHVIIITSKYVQVLPFPSKKKQPNKKDPQLFQDSLGEFLEFHPKIIHPHLDPSQSQGR